MKKISKELEKEIRGWLGNEEQGWFHNGHEDIIDVANNLLNNPLPLSEEEISNLLFRVVSTVRNECGD